MQPSPNTKRKIMLIQHQQRSSMDTDALDYEELEKVINHNCFKYSKHFGMEPQNSNDKRIFLFIRFSRIHNHRRQRHLPAELPPSNQTHKTTCLHRDSPDTMHQRSLWFHHLAWTLMRLAQDENQWLQQQRCVEQHIRICGERVPRHQFIFMLIREFRFILIDSMQLVPKKNGDEIEKMPILI